ncbi:hypothetical protein HYG86_14685 [Alkalicella caledoniensis]|uniref:Uncharacterized protein n=1 Tax=Alkalicella caledoniensis TaxID=2731377 RepID=A0A7G9WB62_ALKCA|nr:hypothetical protein [Alkalicella caledoniensis]QNO15924.1 hypothetical protein HYG86_14685 [Alkalicella caledoniensis]
MLIEQTIDEFLRKKSNYIGYEIDTVQNLLQSDKKYSLLYICGLGEIEGDSLKYSIKTSVKAYSSIKDSAIDIYKKYLGFLSKKFGIYVDVDFPPIPISISFERIMYIAKYLQNPEHEVKHLEDILWVSHRTVLDDIAKLRGNTDDPLQVCGKKFIIEDMERRRGRVTMASTAHPIFLTGNLTQVIVTLKGLKSMSQDSAYRSYAMEMAKSIWTQLSDYAKDRIILVVTEMLPDEVEWYLSLGDKDDNSFYSEYMCSNTEGAGCVIDCLKNRKECYIEYQREDNSVVFYEDCKVIDYDDTSFTVIHKGEKVRLISDNILRSSYTIEELV